MARTFTREASEKRMTASVTSTNPRIVEDRSWMWTRVTGPWAVASPSTTKKMGALMFHRSRRAESSPQSTMLAAITAAVAVSVPWSIEVAAPCRSLHRPAPHGCRGCRRP